MQWIIETGDLQVYLVLLRTIYTIKPIVNLQKSVNAFI